MKLKVMLDPGAKIPTRAHKNDGGLDLYSRDTVAIPAFGSALFDTGVHVSIPAEDGGVKYVGFVKSKSGLMTVNDITTDGVVDAGFTGSIKVKLFNNCHARYVVEAGQKIAQLVLLPIITPEPEVVTEFDATERGDNGFGSSGLF